MKITQIIIVMALIIVAMVTLISAREIVSGNYIPLNLNQKTVNTVLKNTNYAQKGVQNIKLSYINYKYQLEPSVMTKGIPVRMEVDTNTVTGCMQYVVISAFGVKKYVDSSDNIIEFTPDKAGTFSIACSMGMGRQQFTVVDSNGEKSDYVEPVSVSSGGSCGGGGGGCGCGG